jgi:formate dehydrogenase maturation protein FdhE
MIHHRARNAETDHGLARIELTKLSDRVEHFPCPACGAEGQIDIREGSSGRCYLSCPACFKMWQEVRDPTAPPVATWHGH